MDKLILTSLSSTELKQLVREVFVEFNPKAPAIPSSYTERNNDIEFDIPGLAKYLKCSIQTVHNLKKDGAIPFYRLGRNIYFKKSEIDKTARVNQFLENVLA